MKYSGGNSSTLFCEQVGTVTALFEQWSDCERTVVMYALTKRLRYPTLKFLQSSIEYSLTQNFGSQTNLTNADINANNPIYLATLINAYKTFPLVEISDLKDNDLILYGSNSLLSQSTDGCNKKKYHKKEDILNDFLGLLPLLRTGNDEAKTVYLSLIPIAVQDAVRENSQVELVQQIFSYMLIHPAISSEDRKSLSHWLRNLEDHIQSQSFYVLSNASDSSSKSTSVSSVGSVTTRSTTWQAIAPPSQSQHKQQQQQQQQNAPTPAPIATPSSEWNVTIPQIPDSLCNVMQGINNLNEIGSSQNSLGLLYDGAQPSSLANSNNSNNLNSNSSNGSNSNNTSISNQSNDDHHVSFSKNGTEIIDFDSCDNYNNANSQFGFQSLLNSCDDGNMPRFSLDSQMAAIKTRRSNSLTTAISSSSSSTSSVVTVNDNCSNSSENLALYAQKPRSYSLSIEHHRGLLRSSGSDTRLDDLKPSYLNFATHNVGMGNIGQWLKSLRLHKYVGLFTNMLYDDMMGISEEYLQSLGVTKGASHKLALCIEKLKERYSNLYKMEEELQSGQMTVNTAIEDLTNIVLTPMKPVDSTPTNVAAKFLRVLDLICHGVMQREGFTSQDEDCVSVVLWILERAIHSEPFLAHTNQLKEHKFKLSKLKMSFAPKNHHAKNGSNGNLNKPRWTKSRKSDVGLSKTGSNDRIHRKNSNDFVNFLSTSQQTSTSSTMTNLDTDKFFQMHSMSSNHHLQQQSSNGLLANNGGNATQYKSSSYPNFGNSMNIGGQQQHLTSSHPQQQQQQQQQQQLHQQYSESQQKQFRHHRHSLNNLIVVSTSSQQPQQATIFNASGNGATTTNRRSSLTKSIAPIVTPAAVAATQLSQPTTTKISDLGLSSVVMGNLTKWDEIFTNILRSNQN